MALISCPECKRTVSDRAATCPNCGYPLAQASAPNLENILCSGTWVGKSGTLVDAVLYAAFSPDHSFDGQTQSDPTRVSGMQLVSPARFQGRWQATATQLFLDFPLTTLSGPSQTQVAIQLTQISDESIAGVDAFLRGWEWQKVA